MDFQIEVIKQIDQIELKRQGKKDANFVSIASMHMLEFKAEILVNQSEQDPEKAQQSQKILLDLTATLIK